MISYIKGKIQAVGKDNVVVETASGIGYEIYLSKILASKYFAGQNVEFFTYLKVSENAMDLYGFEDISQKEFFEILLSVSGVGPKSAMNILNLGSMEDIKGAIAREDVKYLTAVQGMGQKTAERLVVELKNKIGKLENIGELTSDNKALTDVIDGLTAMGYGKEEIKAVVNGLNTADKNAEELLKIVLRQLSK
ncbi:MAG: Holliday junction DNA helicase RuvA [Candidatus Magasanikbacteria bacterium RIFCSPHIGHO2_01_FULL_33_34]|uniref:Holliday junction branch migration complex subunit RuvA n=1 Tax=Candidatus Magasanikbacteria bacterium RIFCSPHIGHO2_01_FULL_33_34 TaxID=1798671 RepID=A0A1F6LH50_9BACT|nr:MAG: Holliday junction DNA helicase RuvA [Candidatus Magasanikbacteria bacterium RIFCSPHIGHO2_01_FULL_33_34]OGH66140.1 MAG: Holliday junction DNA helicase RuvA [Candidatus Magasanikbacteria bacterium RIFCSPHIGHO2_02_FULL_33_17]OGH75986.1 MAG: Holliday junction DNA helicase RuvA [Candidatus Magasanikbacteria bacterium RIFCSPLOWO2_01_FULL_33_34]OGH81572.1 MAG: Holliday junction DNA helicase RuvA [Candidatus Magasanikbacteria bacterium RIFCSPLOWO2_12_FULL_34_7]